MDKNKATNVAEQMKNEGIIVKIVRIGDSYFVLKPITIKEFFEYRQKESITQTDEMDFVISHVVEDQDIVKNAPAGMYERLKDMLFEVSGFTSNVNIVYDPTVTKYLTDVSVLAEKLTNTNPNAKIVTINKIPFAILPVNTSEYMEYKSNTDKLLSLPEKEAFKKAYELDRDLVAKHVIYPTDLPDEAGYLELLFQSIWQISGFSQDVEVIEV